MQVDILNAASLSRLIDPETRLGKRGLLATGNLHGVLLFKTSSGVDRLYKFKILDLIPEIGLRDQLLAIWLT